MSHAPPGHTEGAPRSEEQEGAFPVHDYGGPPGPLDVSDATLDALTADLRQELGDLDGHQARPGVGARERRTGPGLAHPAVDEESLSHRLDLASLLSPIMEAAILAARGRGPGGGQGAPRRREAMAFARHRLRDAGDLARELTSAAAGTPLEIEDLSPELRRYALEVAAQHQLLMDRIKLAPAEREEHTNTIIDLIKELGDTIATSPDGAGDNLSVEDFPEDFLWRIGLVRALGPVWVRASQDPLYLDRLDVINELTRAAQDISIVLGATLVSGLSPRDMPGSASLTERGARYSAVTAAMATEAALAILPLVGRILDLHYRQALARSRREVSGATPEQRRKAGLGVGRTLTDYGTDALNAVLQSAAADAGGLIGFVASQQGG